MSIGSIERSIIADIKAKLATLSDEAKVELGFGESWATKNFEWVILGAFVLGIGVKAIF